MSGAGDDHILVLDCRLMDGLGEVLHEPCGFEDAILHGERDEVLRHCLHHGSVPDLKHAAAQKNDPPRSVGNCEIDERFGGGELIDDGWRDDEDGGDGVGALAEWVGVGCFVEPVELHPLAVGEGWCIARSGCEEDWEAVRAKEWCDAGGDFACAS